MSRAARTWVTTVAAALMLVLTGGTGSAAEPPAADGHTHSMTTIDGATTRCTVKSIEPDGRIRITAPWLAEEAFARTSSLDQITFPGTSSETGGHCVFIVNGDAIVGRLSGIGADAVTLESDLMGTVRIPRRVITHITCSGAGGMLLDTDFTTGMMGPWKPVKGKWAVVDGRLVCQSGGGDSRIAARIDQEGPVTFEMHVAADINRRGYAIVMFAESTREFGGERSLVAHFQYGRFLAMSVSPDGGQDDFAHSSSREMARGTERRIRLAYDPAKATLSVWINKKKLDDYTVPNPPKAGKYLILQGERDMRIRYIRMQPGTGSPEADPDEGSAAGDLILLANGDKFTASAMSLADGTIVARVASGELRFPAEHLRRLTMATGDKEHPRRNRGDVVARTMKGSVTLQLQQLTDDHLVGTSDYMGPVKIRRDALRRIQFNIYAPSRTE